MKVRIQVLKVQNSTTEYGEADVLMSCQRQLELTVPLCIPLVSVIKIKANSQRVKA